MCLCLKRQQKSATFGVSRFRVREKASRLLFLGQGQRWPLHEVNRCKELLVLRLEEGGVAEVSRRPFDHWAKTRRGEHALALGALLAQELEDMNPCLHDWPEIEVGDDVVDGTRHPDLIHRFLGISRLNNLVAAVLLEEVG